jgi:hypothetical protein
MMTKKSFTILSFARSIKMMRSVLIVISASFIMRVLLSLWMTFGKQESLMQSTLKFIGDKGSYG